MMTESPINQIPDGHDDISMARYYSQKTTLEQASRQLRYKSNWPMISIIKPGGVATQANIDNSEKMETHLWVKSVLEIFANNDHIKIPEITVGYSDKRIPI